MNKNLRCNACGRKIEEENGILREDVFEGRKEWGYFSKKDLTVDEFFLCESCYDLLLEKFTIPVKRTEKNEVL